MLRAPGACLDTPSSRAVTMVRPSLETESSSAGCHTTSPARCCCHRSCGTCTEGNDMSEMDPNTGANPRIRITHLYSSVQIGTENGATTQFQSAGIYANIPRSRYQLKGHQSTVGQEEASSTVQSPQWQFSISKACRTMQCAFLSCPYVCPEPVLVN